MTRIAISPRQQNQVTMKKPSGVFPSWYAFDESFESTSTKIVLPSPYTSFISEMQELPEMVQKLAAPPYHPSRTLVVIRLELSVGSR